MIMSTQIQKKQTQHSGKHLNEWDVIKRNRLIKLHALTNLEADDLISSVPKARLDMWCHLNGMAEPENNARQIFYNAIMQSCLACKTRGSSPDMTSFHRDMRAEFTNQVYRHLFYKLDPKLEIAEEICKYLDF